MPRTCILLVGCDPRVAAVLASSYEVCAARSADEAQARLGDGITHVLVVGDDVSEGRREALIELATLRGVVVLHAGRGESAPQHASLFYSFAPSLPAQQLVTLVDVAAARCRGEPLVSEAPTPRAAATGEAAHWLHRVLGRARRLAARSDLAGAAADAVSAVLELTDCERAYCWFHDAESGELWRPGSSGEETETTASRGLVGFAARTGRALHVPHAAADPRRHPPTDDPEGRGREQLLVQPVIGPDRDVHAVLVAVRAISSGVLQPDEVERLALFAACCGPAFHQLALQLEARATAGSPPELFRVEALESHTHRGREGDVVRIVPSWVWTAYVAVVIALVAGVAFLVLGRIDDYSSGPAVVRLSDRTEVTASSLGTIEAVLVSAGDEVQAGAVLARLYDPDDEGGRLEREFDDALRDHLLHADGDRGGEGETIRSLRLQLDQARARREARLVRAPHAGVIGDVRVRPGQAIAPGEIVASLVADTDALGVVAILPGADRPMLAPGMPLRLEIEGYRDAWVDLVVGEVGAEVVGPAELARALGPVAESLAPAGSSVVVRATLPSPGFEADGRDYRFHDGMPARASVRLHRESILDALLPDLEQGKARR